MLAADYNYGQITAKWVAHYVKQRGGSIAQTSFFPLDVSDFGSTIAKIQEAKPDAVCAALVGGAHLSFFRQWAASGMNKKIPLFSTTFGVGNEHLALSPAEGDGILIAGNYSQEETTPANKDFLARWAKRFGDTKIVHEIAVSQYQGIKLWAEAVKKAGSMDREKLIKTLIVLAHVIHVEIKQVRFGPKNQHPGNQFVARVPFAVRKSPRGRNATEEGDVRTRRAA